MGKTPVTDKEGKTPTSVADLAKAAKAMKKGKEKNALIKNLKKYGVDAK